MYWKLMFQIKVHVITDNFIINICLKMNRKTTLDDDKRVMFN